MGSKNIPALAIWPVAYPAFFQLNHGLPYSNLTMKN